jgi:hypothetical protein
MGYMKIRKFQRNQRLTCREPLKKAAGEMVEVTYTTEDGKTVKQLLNPKDKLLVMWAEDKVSVEKPIAPGWGWRKVTNVFHGETMEWLHVLVTDDEIKCTQEHPFAVKGKGWVAARDLQPGDELITSSGKECVVIKTWLEILDKPERTYNIEVEGAHNYCVGNSGILVHNVCVAGPEDGYQAIVNPSNEHGLPHAHILKDGQRIAQIDKFGTVSKGVFDHGARRFVKNNWDDILKGIIKHFPKK